MEERKMQDLSLDPTAERVTPVNRQLLPAVPKQPTTATGGTTTGGYSDRTYESRERLRHLHEIKNPPPTLVDYYISLHRQREAAEAVAEKAKLEQAKVEERRLEQRLAETRQRIANTKKFRAAEKMVEIALDSLTQQERSRIYEKLLSAGRVHDVEYAMSLAQIAVASRTAAPIESNEVADWRAALKKSK